MTGILGDNDVGGQVALLVGIWQSPAWQDVWTSLGLAVHSFPELVLEEGDPDSKVWETCQRVQVVLITGNRNDDGPNSLEATIRKAMTPQGLPVITLADPRRVSSDRGYRHQVAAKVLEYLLEIEKYRGVGRLYVP